MVVLTVSNISNVDASTFIFEGMWYPNRPATMDKRDGERVSNVDAAAGVSKSIVNHVRGTVCFPPPGCSCRCSLGNCIPSCKREDQNVIWHTELPPIMGKRNGERVCTGHGINLVCCK